MKFTIDTHILQSALKRVLPATKGAYLAQLSGIVLEAQDGQLSAAATNLDLTVNVTAACNVGEPGRVLVPSALVAGFASKAPAETISVVVGDDVELRSGRSKTRLRTLSLDDYPKIPIPEGKSVHLKTEQVNLLRKLVHAAAVNHDNEKLNIVRFQGGRAWATDGYRAAMADLGGDVTGSVNAQSLVEVLRHADIEDGLGITADDNRIMFSDPDASWTLRQVEGDAPNVPRLFDENNPPNKLAVDREAFIDAIERVALVAQDSYFILNPAKTSVEVTASQPDIGETEDSVPAEFSGDANRVGFKPRYLLDALNQCDSQIVVLQLDSGVKAARIDEDALHLLVMPWRMR